MLGCSFLFPFKADPELIVNPAAVLAGSFTLEGLQPIAAKDGDVLERLSCVQPYQSCASLILYAGEKLERQQLMDRLHKIVGLWQDLRFQLGMIADPRIHCGHPLHRRVQMGE